MVIAPYTDARSQGDPVAGFACEIDRDGMDGSWEGGWSARVDHGKQFHFRAAVRTARDGWLGENGFGFVEFSTHQRTDQQARPARGPAHPAVVAHAHETGGQHMGEPALEEGVDI